MPLFDKVNISYLFDEFLIIKVIKLYKIRDVLTLILLYLVAFKKKVQKYLDYALKINFLCYNLTIFSMNCI
jgi:hypothetical protein